MIKEFLKPNKTLPKGLDAVRIITGGIIFSYGLEIFDQDQLAGYIQWLTDVGMPLPKIMMYIGKFSELFCGLCLAVGLFTRFSSIPLMITMCVINFIMLDGNLRTEPFCLLLLFTSFFFVGSGQISIDSVIHKGGPTNLKEPNN